MAPEVFASENVMTRYTTAIDIYSSALTIWYMFNGEEPFLHLEGLTVAQLASRQELRPGLQGSGNQKIMPAGIASLLQRSWNTDPACRPSAAEMEDAITEAVANERSWTGAFSASMKTMSSFLRREKSDSYADDIGRSKSPVSSAGSKEDDTSRHSSQARSSEEWTGQSDDKMSAPRRSSFDQSPSLGPYSVGPYSRPVILNDSIKVSTHAAAASASEHPQVRNALAGTHGKARDGRKNKQKSELEACAFGGYWGLSEQAKTHGVSVTSSDESVGHCSALISARRGCVADLA